jgi:hypothetical protein
MSWSPLNSSPMKLTPCEERGAERPDRLTRRIVLVMVMT